jgi:hypothetical protein
MRELLFDQDAEQDTFQVSYGHQLSKFSPEDLESHVRSPITNYFSLFPFSFSL